MVSALGSRVGWASARKERTNELVCCVCALNLQTVLNQQLTKKKLKPIIIFFNLKMTTARYIYGRYS